LANHPNLKRLGLGENWISEDGAAALAEAVQSNKAIQIVKLFDQGTEDGATEITKATLKKIRLKLKKNKNNPYTKEDDERLAAEQIRLEEVSDGVTKHVFREGTGKVFPAEGAQVTAKYRGTLANGDVFDSGLLDFQLGQGKVIKCWDKAFITMKKGEKALLVCSSDQAYGDAGSGDKIKGGATLKFDVELVVFDGPTLDARTPAERAKDRKTEELENRCRQKKSCAAKLDAAKEKSAKAAEKAKNLLKVAAEKSEKAETYLRSLNSK